MDRNAYGTGGAEHPTSGIDRKRAAAQLNCVRSGNAGDVSPPVHHDPPARRGGPPNEIPCQLQASNRLHAAGSEVHGNRTPSGFEQRGDPTEGIDPREFFVETDDVESGDVYWNRSPS